MTLSEPSPFPCLSSPPQDIIDIQQLTRFARNPLKTYFNHGLGVYLEEYGEGELEREERFTLSALESYMLRQNAFSYSVDDLLVIAEKSGRLPLGTFKTVAKQNVKGDIQRIKDNLKSMGCVVEEHFQVELHVGCRRVEQISEKRWVAPALTIASGGGDVTIVGTLPFLTQQGMIAHGKGDVGDLSKAWPAFLLLSCLAEFLPFPIELQVLLTKEREGRKTFFKDAPRLLSDYIDYYHTALWQPSLLLPEWLPDLLKQEPSAFIQRCEEMMYGHVKRIYNPYVYRLFPRGAQWASEEMVGKWKEQAHRLFGGIAQHWG